MTGAMKKPHTFLFHNRLMTYRLTIEAASEDEAARLAKSCIGDNGLFDEEKFRRLGGKLS